MCSLSYKVHMETNFAWAAPEDPVTLRKVESTVQRRWGAAVEKSVCCIIYVFRAPHEWSSWGCSSSMKSTTPSPGLQQDAHRSLMGRKIQFSLSCSGPCRCKVAEQATTSMHFGSGRCALLHRGWPMTFLLHRETKQSDWNSCLTTGIPKPRHILDPLSSKERKEKEKNKDTTHSEWVHSKYNSSQLSVIMPGVNLFPIFIKHCFGKSKAKF